MTRVVALGCGTEVGKTFVVSALGHALHQRYPDARIRCLKPLETGFAPSAPPAPGSDAAVLECSSFHVKPARPHPAIALAEPISPHLAARREGVSVTLDGLTDWVDRWSSEADWVVVETAGGACSPVTDRATNLDLARASAPDRLLLVARDRLGVLHELSSTLAAVRAARLSDPICILSSPPDAPAHCANAEEARRLRIAPDLIVVRTASDAERIVEVLS